MSSQLSPSHAMGTSVPTSPAHAFFSGNRTVEDLVDEIVGGCSQGTTQGKGAIETWTRAKKAHAEVKNLLLDKGLKNQGPKFLTSPSGGLQPCYFPETTQNAARFFPKEWWRALSAEPLADLVVDYFMNAFCDAFVDELVSTVQTQECWVPRSCTSKTPSAQLSHCQSAPTILQRLSKPAPLSLPRCPFEAMPPAGSSSKTPLRLSPSSGPCNRSSARDGRNAWNLNNYHACQPLAPYKDRISQTTELLRPCRRLQRAPVEDPFDKRKFCWPLAATNFPDYWESTTRRKKLTGARQGRDVKGVFSQQVTQTSKDDQFHLKVDDEGRTNFPYSLALHKAFLESQSSTDLKSKACEFAPMKFTCKLD